MPRSSTTGVFARVSNSFSNPVFGTLIDPTDADAYFDDLDVGLNPPELDGPVRFINSLQVGTTGTAAGTIDFLNATSGSITLSPPAGALGTRTLTLPAATDTLVARDTVDTLVNKTLTAPIINGAALNSLTGFSLRDTSAAFDLTFTATSSPALSAGRTLTIDMNNASHTLDLAADLSIGAGGFTTTGGSALVLTVTGSTNVTLPTTGTLMTLGGTETVTGVKTFGSAGAVGRLKLAGNTSGTITLDATAVAGTNTLTLPAATDTLVGKATTDTFTNKTLTASSNVLGGVTLTLGSDATGDIYYRNSGSVLTRLAVGAAGSYLTPSSGLPSWKTPAATQVSNQNPTGTTSLTGVMMGLGGSCTITPVYSSRVYVIFTGNWTNSTAGSITEALLKFGTGAAPSNGAAATGTTLASGKDYQPSTASNLSTFALCSLVTGLSPGTAYWFDIDLLVSANTGTISKVDCLIVEF